MRICPKCHRKYNAIPALSRSDNETMICPECGTREALEVFGITQKECEEIIKIIKEKGGQ